MAQNPPARVEQSTLSRSTTAIGDKAVRSTIINGRTTIFDQIFPLMDEVLKMTRIPDFLYLCMMIFMIFQMVCISLYVPFDWQFHSDTGIGRVLVWIIQITLFIDLGNLSTSLLVRFVIFGFFAITFFILVVYQKISFQLNRRFFRWSLYVTRFYYEFFSSIMLAPCGYFIGEVAYEMIKTNDKVKMIYFAFSLLFYLIFIYGNIIMTRLFTGSVYIPNSPNASWDYDVHFKFVIAPGVFGLVTWISKMFASWTQPLIIILKILLNLYIMISLKHLPFIHIESNALVGSLHLVLTAFDILALIQYFGIYIDYSVHVIVFFVLFFVGTLIFKVIIQSIVKKVSKQLNYDVLESIEIKNEAQATQNFMSDNYMYLTDPAKRQHYFNNGLDRSVSKCNLFMRIGIATGGQLFIDWSLLKFVAEYHNSAQTLAKITQFLSYFPCESRLLNYFFYTLTAKQKINFSARFTAFEVHRIKGIRQSSASSEITEKLMELKQLSLKGINFVHNYWESVPKDPSLLYDLYISTVKTTHMYRESIEKWPNNCRLCDDYSNYLIECATDFEEGLKIKYRSELIERGKNFALDHSFRSLVRAYPLYLMKQIMDVKGNFVKKVKSGGSLSSSSSNSGSQMSTNNIDGQLDIEVEEQLGKSSFTYPKLRLAYQRSFANRRSYSNYLVKVHSFISLLIGNAILLFLFFWLHKLFDNKSFDMKRQFLLNNIRYGYDATFVTLAIYWGVSLGFLTPKLFGNEKSGLAMRSPISNIHNLQFSHVTHPFPPYFDNNKTVTIHFNQIETDMLYEIKRWVDESKSNLNSFIKQVEIIAYKGRDVNTAMSAMINSIVPYDFCIPVGRSQIPLGKPINSTLISIIVYDLLKVANLTQIRYGSGGPIWLVDKGVCENIINIGNVFNGFDTVTKSLSDEQNVQNIMIKKENQILYYVLVIVFVSIFIVDLNVVVHNMIKELNFIIKIMSGLDKKSKEEASKPVKLNFIVDTDVMKETKSKKSISPGFYHFMVTFFIILFGAIFVVVVHLADTENDKFLELNKWLYYGISRGNLMLESFLMTLINIFAAKHPGVAPMLSLQGSSYLARKSVQKLAEYNNILLRGGSDVRACIGVNEKLDYLNFGSTDCPNSSDYLNGCMAIDRGISLFSTYITQMLNDPANVDYVNKTTFLDAFNLMNNYLVDPTYEAAIVLTELSIIEISQFHNMVAGFCFGFIAFCSLGFVVFYVSLVKIDLAFFGAFQLLRRLPPLSVISNIDLLNYLLNKKEDKTETKMSPAMSVIMNSKDSVLFLNKQESIEVVNKSVTQLFGYTPEQLLGQPLATVIPEEENPKIYEQMGYMKDGEVPMTFEINTSGISNDDQLIPVNLTVIGIPDVHRNSAESFVVIMRDYTQIQKQRKEAEEAKKQSETLLYQILPRDIVVRLNRGEVDISFVVPSSTVIFIDVVKFSDYASTLTPAQIMENLSIIFASFDTMCKKYELITKIKLIGDVYMAAANLFTPDESTQAHASQVIQFGLDVLQALEDCNTQLDSSLQVRIGVNTDGPLIAGVLGTDKPVFDIIGDPINVAARMQSMGIPGTVQISQATYDQICNLNFNIEKRGEIMLKGKGKKMAYVVRPMESSSFFANGNNT